MARKTIIAIMYDFDRTLSIDEMQRYTFMPAVHTTAEKFWAESDELAVRLNMDPNLAYMYLMLKKARENGIKPTRDWMVKLGEGVQLYPGLTKWFERVTKFGEDNNVSIEHYVISSGLKEIIEGTNIYKYFKRVYACEYNYDEVTKEAIWPKSIVNYTTKTQFLFRISKGTFELADDHVVNQHVPETMKHCPFRNMIYIGDGSTDIPCMQLVRDRGGESIAVYPDAKNKSIAQQLLKDDRVSFMERADYSLNSPLDRVVKDIILKMAINDQLAHKRYNQTNSLPEEE